MAARLKRVEVLRCEFLFLPPRCFLQSQVAEQGPYIIPQ